MPASCTERDQLADLGRAVDAAGADDGDILVGDAKGLVSSQHARHGGGEIEAGITHVFWAGSAEVAAGEARMLDHDGVGQAVLAHPFLEQQRHAAGVGEDRDQRHVGEVGGQVRQIQRQAGPHHHRVGAVLAGTAHAIGVLGDRAHHVDGNRPAPVGNLLRQADLSGQGRQVGGLDAGPVTAAPGGGHQVWMEAPQVDAGDGAHRRRHH